MSMPHSVIYCDGCDYRGGTLTLWGLFKYRFDDGHEFHVKRMLGWCSGCKGARPIEVLPHSAVTERELADVRERIGVLTAHGLKSWLASALSRRRRAEIQRLRDKENDLKHVQHMLTSRTSPPRCLRCGSTSVVSLPVRVDDRARYDYDLGMRHPDCGGSLHCRDSGGTRFAIASKLKVYSSEGELISATSEGQD